MERGGDTVTSTDHADGDDRVAEVAHYVEARYELQGEIARGGSGRILRARDKALDRDVAIKVPLDPERGARIRAEAAVLSQLQHPAIVPVYDIGIAKDGSPFYAMKLVEGKSLREVLRAAETLEQRLALVPHVIAIAEAMASAHTLGIIHRDLKPGNVLIGPFGETLVIDWGLARRLDAELETTAVEGTPGYMSPEQAKGDRVDARTDVFAIGAILYHLIAGAAPQRSESLEELQPRAPRDLIAIANKAMAPLATRYPSARELAEDLVRFQAGRLVSARRYSPVARASLWIRRNRLVVVAALVALAAGATAVTVVNRPAEALSCEAIADEDLAALWNDDVRRTITAGIRSGDRAAWDRATLHLDNFLARWRVARVETCAASRTREGSSQEVELARLACLERRRDEVRAMVSLATSSPNGASRAPDMIYALGSLGDCDNRAILGAVEPQPADLAVRAAIAGARRITTEAKAAFDAGEFVLAVARAETAVRAARGTGYRPLIAEALVEQAMAAVTSGDAALVEKALTEAIDLAEASRADLVAARAWIVMPMVFAITGKNPELLDGWHRRARAALDRVGNPPRLEGIYGVIRGTALFRSGRSKESSPEYERALAIWRAEADPDLMFYSLALHDVGIAKADTRRPSAAKPYLDETIELITSRLGHSHPNLVLALSNRAELAAFLGDPARARTDCERAAALASAGVHSEASDPFRSAIICARALVETGDATKALARMEAVDPQPFPQFEFEWHQARGAALRELGRVAEARAEHQRGKERCQTKKRCLALVRLELARDALASGDRAEARRLAAEALDAPTMPDGYQFRWQHERLVILAEAGDDPVRRLAAARELEGEGDVGPSVAARRRAVEARLAAAP